MSPFTIRTATRVVARSVGTVTAAGILSLLAAFPALADDPFFTLHFGSNADSSTNPGGVNGILGEATYTFSETTLGQMTLTLKNLSGAPATEALLVSSGFIAPTNPPADANVIIASFTEPNSGWKVILGDSISPFGSFDACAASSSLGGCDAGGTPDGLEIGSLATDVAIFTLNSSPALTSATDYRNAFVAMFSPPPPTGDAGGFDGNYFMRFKGITGTNYTSDKVWATSIVTGGGNGGEAPGDEVPGPLPLFGAAAAFGYSRKLRQRLKARTLIG